MKILLFTRNGKVGFDPENCPEIYRDNNPVRIAVESCFEDWINGQPKDIQQMYTLPLEEYRGDTFLSYCGAVEDAINDLLEYLRENKITHATTNIFYPAEITTAFERGT